MASHCSTYGWPSQRPRLQHWALESFKITSTCAIGEAENVQRSIRQNAVCFAVWDLYKHTSILVFVLVLFTGFSNGQLGFLSLWYTTKLPAHFYGGVDTATQWLPSGHYEDQLYEVELQSLAVRTMGGDLGTRKSCGSLQQQERTKEYSLLGKTITWFFVL